MAKNNSSGSGNRGSGSGNSGSGARSAAPSTNSSIRSSLSNAGGTVSYKEANKVATNLGVSVDRVYNQTAKTGQTAKAGAAAANAGYVPSSQLKVGNPITASYVQQYAANAQAGYQQQQQQNTGEFVQGTLPEFDWEAWNAQMMAQQAAIWESMDRMNSEFMRQQQAYLEQQGQRRVGSFSGGGAGSADLATVRRKKKTNTQSNTKTNTGLSTPSAGGAGGSGLSLGGSSSNGLGIGRNV